MEMGSEPLGKGVTQIPKDRTYPSDTFHGVGECVSYPPLGAFPLANIHLRARAKEMPSWGVARAESGPWGLAPGEGGPGHHSRCATRFPLELSPLGQMGLPRPGTWAHWRCSAVRSSLPLYKRQDRFPHLALSCLCSQSPQPLAARPALVQHPQCRAVPLTPLH